jgi:Flp pilus assembly protein TadD
VFPRIAELRPKDRQLWVAKLNRHAPRAQWKEAAVAMAKLTELDPSDHLNWFNQAPILVEIGDLDGYRRVCREMLERFSKTDRPEIVERTAKTCLLAPDAVDDLKAVVKLADRALTGTEKSGLYKWFLMARGMADYRAGQYAAAIDRLGKALTPGREYVFLDGTAQLFIAMAHHGLGHEAEARQALAKARTLMDQQSPKLDQGQLLGGDWSDWLRFQIARREAEALLTSKAR